VGEVSLSQVLPGGFGSQEPPSGGRGRGAVRQARRRKRKRRRRSVFVILLVLALVAAGGYGAYVGLKPLVKTLTEPNDYTGTGTGRVEVKIPDGASGRAIAQVLSQDGVVKTPSSFLDALDADPTATAKLQPGTYALRSKMSAKSALALLLTPSARLTNAITIKEGMRVKDILTLMAKDLKLNHADLVKASTSKDIDLPAAAKGKPEGYLFPATYQFPPDETATDALKAMVDKGNDTYAALGISASDLHDIVIKASIIQAESVGSSDMGKVSRVLDNRLKDNMKLALDSTVSYATQKFGITTTAADRQVASRYNTYRYAGLPVGPIDNPGETALKAAANPTPGQWLYFTTVNPDTGDTRFENTDTQHEADVKLFQAWLAQQNK
jgi:UPF0755 protein